MTQAELASRAGVTVETVARLERVLRGRASANANPSLETMERIASSLGVDVSDLVSPSKVRGRSARLDPRRPTAPSADRRAPAFASVAELWRARSRLRSARARPSPKARSASPRARVAPSYARTPRRSRAHRRRHTTRTWR